MRWKWVLMIAAGLMIASFVSVYVILSRYDLNQFKPQIAQAVKDATGRELTLEGDIHLQFGLTPVLAVENVTFQNAPWGSRPELARIKHFEVNVALIPLLRGTIEIKRFVLVEPDILIETDPSGRSNLTFEAIKEPSPALPKGEVPEKEVSRPTIPTIEEIQIEKGSIEYRDGQSGKTFRVALDRFTVEASGTDGPIQLEGKGACNGKVFTVFSTLGPPAALSEPGKAWPVKVVVQAAGATAGVSGGIKNALTTAEYTFDIHAEGNSVADLAGLAGAESVPELGPFKAAGKITGRKDTLSVDEFDFQSGVEELAALSVSGSIKEPLSQRGVQIDFKVYGKDLARLGVILGKPITIQGPFQASGRLSDSGDRVYQVSGFKVVAGDNDLEGSAEVNLSGAKPGITASLSSNNLDLRPFLPPDPEVKGTAAESARPVRKDKVFPSDPLSLDALKPINANIQVQARQLFTPRLAIKDLNIGVKIQDEALTLDPFKAGVGGGTLDGRILLWPKGKAVGVETVLKVTKLDADLVARELDFKESFGGKLDLNLNLKGIGSSVAQIMAGLNGKTLLVLSNARIHNRYLDLLGADLSRSALRLLNPFSQDAKLVEINCFVSGFKISNGMAESTALVLDTNHVSVVGQGKINLKTEGLDISFRPSPKEGTGVTGIGKTGVSLSELAKPLKLSGTLAKPTLTIDPTQTALTIGKVVGEAVLLGPAGIAAFLAGGSPTEENACLAAIDASNKGVKPSGGKLDAVQDTARKTTEAVGDKLKKMFGR